MWERTVANSYLRAFSRGGTSCLLAAPLCGSNISATRPVPAVDDA